MIATIPSELLISDIKVGNLKLDRSDGTVTLLRGGRVFFKATKHSRIFLTIDMQDCTVIVRAGGDEQLRVPCKTIEDAIDSMGLLARCLASHSQIDHHADRPPEANRQTVQQEHH